MERTENNPLGIKPITEFKDYMQRMHEAIHYDWYFSGWEKLIIVGCFLYTCFSIVRFVWHLF